MEGMLYHLEDPAEGMDFLAALKDWATQHTEPPPATSRKLGVANRLMRAEIVPEEEEDVQFSLEEFYRTAPKVRSRHVPES
jgi:hypothetical protein